MEPFSAILALIRLDLVKMEALADITNDFSWVFAILGR
jgi:hypothetical protein